MSATDTRDPAAMPPWVPRAIALFFAGVVGLVALGWLLLRLRSLLVILLLSLTISFALEPAVNRLERAGLRRGTATLLTFVVSAVVTGLFLWIIGRAVADQAAQLIESGPAYIERVREWADRTFGARFDTGRLLSEFQDGGRLSDAATAIAPNIVAVGSRVLVVLFQMLTVATFSFYLVSDGPRLRRAICALLPPDRQRHVLRAWDVAIDKTGAYIYSRAVLALGSFLFHWVVLLVLGVPSPMALALWIAVVSQFVPVVGTYLAGFLPALVALAERPVSALWLLGAILVYQQVENYLIAPRITAHTMEVHAAVAFGAVLGGAAVLGPIGALLALPVTTTLTALTSSLLQRHEVVDDRLTEEAPPAKRRRWRRAAPQPAEPATTSEEP